MKHVTLNTLRVDANGIFIEEPFGPLYPWSKAKKNGAAVCEAIRTLQRQELARYAKVGCSSPPTCASGTLHNTGKKILAAVRAQNKASAQR